MPDEVWAAVDQGTFAAARPGRPTVLFLRGEIDVAHAHTVRRLLDEAIATYPWVVVDLTDTTFIDACVLGVLARTHPRSVVRLRVRGATGIVARLFELTGMEHLLDP